MQASLPWKLTHLSLRENDINDFGVDEICAIIGKLTNLKKIDIAGNLFYQIRKFREVLKRI